MFTYSVAVFCNKTTMKRKNKWRWKRRSREYVWDEGRINVNYIENVWICNSALYWWAQCSFFCSMKREIESDRSTKNSSVSIDLKSHSPSVHFTYSVQSNELVRLNTSIHICIYIDSSTDSFMKVHLPMSLLIIIIFLSAALIIASFSRKGDVIYNDDLGYEGLAWE